LLRILRDVDEAVAAEAHIRADLARQAVPQRLAVLHQRDFPLVPVEGAAPSPVAAGLFAGDDALFDQRHRMPGLRQVPGGRDADDAGADDDDIRGVGQLRVALHQVERAGRDHQAGRPVGARVGRVRAMKRLGGRIAVMRSVFAGSAAAVQMRPARGLPRRSNAA
jgi:hypothetical protein